MMFKFSKSTLTKVHGSGGRTLMAAWPFVVLGMCVATSLFAQQTTVPTASATPGATPKTQAYVRFWNMFVGKNAPDLQLLAGEDQLLTTASAGNYFAGYLAMDPATYTFIVRRANDPRAVLKRMPIVLRGDTYITLLAADKDGQPDVQLLDDTVDPKTDNGLGTLVVRQFFPGASVTVSTGSAPTTGGQPLTFGESTTWTGLPLRPVTVVSLQATGLGPTPKMWQIETDFAGGGHHATMIVVPDPYGRFRPQLVYDGSARKPLPPPISKRP